MNMKTGGKLKNIFKIAGDVLMLLVVVAAAFTLVLSVSSKKDPDGSANVFGYKLLFVRSDSMDKCAETDVSDFKIKSIKIKSCVFVKTAPKSDEQKDEWYKTLAVGDVVTFKYVYTTQETITHRITDIAPKDGGYLITLEGDNKNSGGALKQVIDTTDGDSPNYIIGKVTGVSYALGLAVYALKSKIGLVCIVIIPCAIIIVFEIMRVMRALSKNKQADEIERLKKQIELLGGEKNGVAENDGEFHNGD